MRIFQSSCRTSTNKPVKITLKTMQLANAIIAGLNSAAIAAVCAACRALWIRKAIIAKYETIVANANRNRKAPNLLAVTCNGTTSVALCKLAPRISLSAWHILRLSGFRLGSDRRRHQTLFRDSHIFSGD
jgi:hypothetical protein